MFLRKEHLSLLNRLRRMGSGKMKLASDMSPEKKAVIMKRIMMKAKPIPEASKLSAEDRLASAFSSRLEGMLSEFKAVAMKQAVSGGGAPPTSSHAAGTKVAAWGWLTGLAGKIKPAPVAAGVSAVRAPNVPGAKAKQYGKGPTPGVHTGNDLSKAMGSGPSTSGWEHLGEEEARLLLKAAMGGAA